MPDDRRAVTAKIEEMAEQIAHREGLEIVEVQLLGGGGARLLRVYIDKPGGVTHGDCELVSGQLGALLDEKDVIPGSAYTLEVSSPGIERKLSKPRDFERFQGQQIRVTLKEPVDNQRRWEGVLGGFAEDTIILEAAGGKTLRFPLAQIKEANLKFDWGAKR